MLAYLIRASKNERAVAPITDIDKAERVEQQLIFQPETRVAWSNRSATVRFWGWQAFAEFAGVGSHWHIDDLGLTAFAGHAWPRATGWSNGSSWSAQLAGYLQQVDPLEAHEDLYGYYSIVSVPSEGRGLVLSDLLSLGPIFWSEDSHSIWFSNRSGMAAEAISENGSPGKSVNGVGWLMFWGTQLSDDTGFEHVKRVPTNSFVELGENHGCRITERSRQIWEATGPLQSMSTYNEVTPLIAEDLTYSLQALANLPTEKPIIHLSGGRDSRVLAAIVAKADLRDHIRFMTYGVPGTADEKAARMVAETARLDWEFEDRSGVTNLPAETSVPIHAGHVEALTNAWDLTGDLEAMNDVRITGNLGEFMGIGPVSQLGLAARSPEEAIEAIADRKSYDLARLLNASANRGYRNQLEQWFIALLDNGADFRMVPHYFFSDLRARTWLGPNRSAKTGLWALPFVTPISARSMDFVASDGFTLNRVHFDLIRIACPELLDVPFSNRPWELADCQHAPGGRRFAEIPPVHSDPSAANWRSDSFRTDRQYFHEIFSDRANPIHQVINSKRLWKLLQQEEVRGGTARMLYGALTASVWLGDHETRPRIHRTASLPRELRHVSYSHGRIPLMAVPSEVLHEAVNFQNQVPGRMQRSRKR